MGKQPSITISSLDYERLSDLLSNIPNKDAVTLESLQQELDRAGNRHRARGIRRRRGNPRRQQRDQERERMTPGHQNFAVSLSIALKGSP